MNYKSLSPFMQRVGLWACAAWLLTACSDPREFVYVDVVEETKADQPNVTVTDENGDETALPTGTTIGVYVVGADGNVTFQQVDVDERGNAMLPTSGQGGGLIAYLPCQEAWGDSALVTTPVFTVADNQSTEALYTSSDLMIGHSGTTTRAAEGGMTFHHMLAKVAIHIIDETGRVDLHRISARLLGVRRSVTVDLLRQSVSPIDEPAADIPMLSEMTTDWRISSYAIVAPQEIAEGSDFFAVTLYGSRQHYPIPGAAVLEGGKTYTINMRLTAHGLVPDGWYIDDWDNTAERIVDSE